MHSVVTVVLISAAACAACAAEPTTSQDDKTTETPGGGPKPVNIVFVLVDDFGWSDVSYNGSRFYRTPHIDRLASQTLLSLAEQMNGGLPAEARGFRSRPESPDH